MQVFFSVPQDLTVLTVAVVVVRKYLTVLTVLVVWKVLFEHFVNSFSCNFPHIAALLGVLEL
jgi:hypothetical protein